MRSFVAKSVDPLDWLTMAGAVLALVFSFFAYYSYHATAAEAGGECAHPADVPEEARGLLRDLCGGTGAGAWHGFFGWFGVVLGLGAAGLVALAVFLRPGSPSLGTRRLAVPLAGFGVLSTVIALPDVPDWPELRSLAASLGVSYSRSEYDRSIADGHGFSYWIVLAVLVVLAAVTLLQYRHVVAAAAVPPANGYNPSPWPAWQPPPAARWDPPR